MAFPASLTLVTVNCQIDLPPDGGGSATLTFTRPLPLTGSTVVPPVPQVLEIGEAGTGSIEVPATDDPQWTPQGYDIAVRLEVGGVSSFGTMQLSHLVTEVDFADVIEWNGSATVGTTYATLTQLNALDAEKLDDPRNVTVGELALPRHGAQPISLVPGRLHCTVFKALKTQTVGTIQTSTGDSDTVAVDADSAWIGVLRWNGATWDPVAVSVDDPTRWAVAGTDYPTAVYAVTPGVGTPNLADPGFDQVAGDTYAYWLIWNGAAEDAPSLYAAPCNAREARIDPTVAMYMDLSAPPSSALNDGWLVGDDRAYQGWLRPA